MAQAELAPVAMSVTGLVAAETVAEVKVKIPKKAVARAVHKNTPTIYVILNGERYTYPDTSVTPLSSYHY